ncbi:gamma carbonic anhydrase family protein [Longirhabdus pacifica]|uniref:gamma carbonic anhydrase family protein n=1 Tax=Longirhabdus pacifica TaxID=2305227 RepID=UPI001008DEE5|nr:gamma carbonic anhydrase family protein [Longirhabdus pacifica]
MLYQYEGFVPFVSPSSYIAEGAKIIGDVHIGEEASVWFNAVLRGDNAPIRIGNRSNIQDGAIGHVDATMPLLVDNDVTIGHAAIVHACQIKQYSLIGMGAKILNQAVIREGALVAAGSVVMENMEIPAYTLCAGVPAKVIRELKDDDIKRMKLAAESYVVKANQYNQKLVQIKKME